MTKPKFRNEEGKKKFIEICSKDWLKIFEDIQLGELKFLTYDSVSKWYEKSNQALLQLVCDKVGERGMITQQKCPICEGTGNVTGGFYNSLAGVPYTSTMVMEQCRNCNGTGVVYVNQDLADNKEQGVE